MLTRQRKIESQKGKCPAQGNTVAELRFRPTLAAEPVFLIAFDRLCDWYLKTLHQAGEIIKGVLVLNNGHCLTLVLGS